MNDRPAIPPRTVAGALLGACASQQAAPPAEQRINQSGYSAAFRQGYADGCNSVNAARRRNEQRYQSDTDYMMGWNDGFSICSRRR